MIGSRRTLSAGIDEVLVDFECVWCHRRIEVDHSGWPYVHSIALLHFHTCEQRPSAISERAIEAAAGRVADALEKRNRPGAP